MKLRINTVLNVGISNNHSNRGDRVMKPKYLEYNSEVMGKLMREGKEINKKNYIEAQLTPEEVKEAHKYVEDYMAVERAKKKLHDELAQR